MKEALKCIYIKNKEDIPKFNQVYNQLFEKQKRKIIQNNKQGRKDKNKNEISKSQSNNINSTQQQKNNENRELIEKRKSKKSH